MFGVIKTQQGPLFGIPLYCHSQISTVTVSISCNSSMILVVYPYNQRKFLQKFIAL